MVDALGADWTLLPLLVIIGSLGWIHLVSPKKWRLLVRSIFGMRLGKQSLRDDLDLQDRTLIVLLALASLSIALFGYQVAVMNGLSAGPPLWLRCLGIVVAVLLGNVLVVRITGFVFHGDGGLTEYLFTRLLFRVGLGIGLLPLVIMIAYPHQIAWRPWLMFGGLALVAALEVFRWLRALWIGLGNGVPLRYIFIYLCALEVLPAVLVVQLLLSLFIPSLHTQQAARP